MDFHNVSVIVVDALCIALLASIFPLAILMQKSVENKNAKGYKSFAAEHAFQFSAKGSKLCDNEDSIWFYGLRKRQYYNLMHGHWHGTPVAFATRSQIVGGEHALHEIPMSIVVIETNLFLPPLVVLHKPGHLGGHAPLYDRLSHLFRKSTLQHTVNARFEEAHVALGDDTAFVQHLLDADLTATILTVEQQFAEHPLHFAWNQHLFFAAWDSVPTAEELPNYLTAVTTIYDAFPQRIRAQYGDRQPPLDQARAANG